MRAKIEIRTILLNFIHDLYIAQQLLYAREIKTEECSAVVIALLGSL